MSVGGKGRAGGDKDGELGIVEPSCAHLALDFSIDGGPLCRLALHDSKKPDNIFLQCIHKVFTALHLFHILLLKNVLN